MKVRHIILLVWISCLLLAVNTGGKQTNGRVYLTGDDLSAWRGDTGQWQESEITADDQIGRAHV